MLLRVKYTKLGKIRFLGHRDVARALERAFRKAELPMRYSEGFSPRPRISFGLALSTGYESVAEYVDIDLGTGGDVDGHSLVELGDKVTAALPPGMEVTAVAELEPRSLSLQQSVTSCSWSIDLDDNDVSVVDGALARALRASTLPTVRERKGKLVSDDLRPLVSTAAVVGIAPHGGVRFTADLGTQPRAVRPAEFVAVLEPPLSVRSACRTHQWIDTAHGRLEPIEAGASAVAHTECAR